MSLSLGANGRLGLPLRKSQCAKYGRRLQFALRAADESGASSSGRDDLKKETKKPTLDAKLPKSGYFSIADPTMEVYSKAGEKFDPTKKGGRYKPEFIWNTNWQEALKREESLIKQITDAQDNRQQYEEEAAQEAASKASAISNQDSGTGGVISFSRLNALDDVNDDLSEYFRERRKRDAEEAAVKAAAAKAAAKDRRRISPTGELVPVRGSNEAARNDRTFRTSRRTINTVRSTKPEEVAELTEQAERDKAQYEAMKQDFQIWTAILIAVGVGATYTAYSSEVSASYLVGALGGFFYLRLLSRTVDSVGGGAEGLAAAAQPRLLIPVVLALVYNRWNLLYADQLDLHLQLFPILIGFFTYKFAVLAREAKKLYDDLYAPQKQDTPQRP